MKKNNNLTILIIIAAIVVLSFIAIRQFGFAGDALYYAKPAGTGENQFHSIYSITTAIPVPSTQNANSYCVIVNQSDNPYMWNQRTNNYETCQYSYQAARNYAEHFESRACPKQGNSCVFFGIVECQGGILASYKEAMELKYHEYCDDDTQPPVCDNNDPACFFGKIWDWIKQFFNNIFAGWKQ